MIISPPFLPTPVAGETDDAYLARAMVGGIPGDGGYPLSFDLNWHGGIHLTAPQEGGSALPVRAVSDGKLAYVRKPTVENTAPQDHPLRYRDKWTDDGCVVIRHETEIGEGAKAKIVFYSIYMHLSKIDLVNPIIDSPIYRMDAIGEAGSVYGEKNRIHFEIVADDSQIENIVGRKDRDLVFKTNEGRKDSFWGDIYFFIPTEVLIYEKPPQNLLTTQNNSPVVYRCPSMPAGPAKIEEAGATTASTGDSNLIQGYEWALASELQEGIFVQMSYMNGECKLKSLTHSGFELGVFTEKSEYEYRLYKIAGDTYPQSPSAGFELLRFGRVLGEDRLQPADAPHWRQIMIPKKVGENAKFGWVNLNHPSITKFSDADFPHWQGWQLIDDDKDMDSHCQSPFIRELLALDISKVVSDNTDAVGIATSPGYNSLTQEQKLQLSERYVSERGLSKARLESTEIQNRIKRLICKFPSEWCKNDFDTRYGWLLKVAENGPMPQETYEKLKKHQQALGFWEAANFNGIESKHWHFPPKEFISAFRKCGWMKAEEMTQCMPRKLLHLDHAVFNVAPVSWAYAFKTIKEWSVPFNLATRRYGIAGNKFRVLHLLSHVIPETAYFRLVVEGGGEDQNYKPYYGRGLIQLTWLANYKIYGDFRKFTTPNTPQKFHALGWDPDVLIARNASGDHNYKNCADSACFYIVQKKNMLSHMDAGVEQDNAIAASRDVNGNVSIQNLNGLDARLQSSIYLKHILLDYPRKSDTQRLTFDWRRNSQKEPALDQNGQVIMIPQPPPHPPKVKKKFYLVTHNIDVPLVHQKP
jgi:hydroxyethylthiazole kinase